MRGPYKLATKDMTLEERVGWWNAYGLVESEKARKRKGRPDEDLGPDLPYSHRAREDRRDKGVFLGYDSEIDDGREYYHAATSHGSLQRLINEVDEGPVDWMPSPFVLRHKRRGNDKNKVCPR